ncbi:MAG: M48 family metallopeptidase [Lachnospiraceae bacterium]|jgi:predicted metal-dependent hydrolase|nr:M48 family metallopeptidase [Lachnospiraceae bacterium]
MCAWFGKKDEIPYAVVRCRRHTMAVSVDLNGEVTVRAPLRTSDRSIADFLRQKQGWIQKKQTEAWKAAAKYAPLTLLEGEWMPILGESYQVHRRFGDMGAAKAKKHSNITTEGQRICIPAALGKEEVVRWLKERLRGTLEKRLEYFSGLMGVGYGSLRVTSARTRWGSCSAKNNVSFTWYLVFCPPDVVDYLVVHELAHVKQKNHSKAFWEAVAAVMPEWKQKRAWLKANRKVMDLL